MAGSRVFNSMRNVFAAWGGQAISVITSFVVRAVFVATLAAEYVGLETLFSSLLTILALADLGIGSAIVFALYEPLAKDDRKAIKSIMRLFKRAYITIGVVIIILGAIMTPNVHFLLGADAPDIPNLEVYFFCFVLNTGVSYFFSYKGALITADQKSYIVYIITYAFQIVMACCQIAVLLLTHNYLIFLVCMVSSTVLQNACIAWKCNRMYPFILEKDVEPINRDTLDTIKKNVAGMILHKLAGAAATPASNLIITTFVGLMTTSLYGNYLLVTTSMNRIVMRAFEAIIASVGNLVAEESEERQYEVFQTTFFIDALIYGTIAGGMLCAFNPFILILTGSEDWCFPWYMVALIVALFYVSGMRQAGQTFISAYGLYWQTKWKAVLEAITLPLFGVVLVQFFGMEGVLAGMILSNVFISTIYEGWAIYKFGLHRELSSYLLRWVLYAATTVVACGAAYGVCSLFELAPIAAFFVKGVIGVVFPIVALLAVFGRKREVREALSIVKRVFGRVAGRIRRKPGAES